MIRAFIFDLDGTLVQTEKLKALSYARAAVELCPEAVAEDEVIEAFKDVVGRSRREVATALVERFKLGEAAAAQMDSLGVQTPWQAYVQIRLRHYEQILADPDVLRRNQWPHNMALLRQARAAHCLVGLATMSHCEQVQRVLQILEMVGLFDFIATRDDVEHAKPDPEIYELVATELATPPPQCLVIEDSPSGVQAALVAGMHCIAVTTPFTRKHLHQQKLLEERWIVDNPEQLLATVEQMLKEEGTTSGPWRR